MPDTSAFASTLTGRVAEYQAILAALDEAAGATILASDPFSGTTSLLLSAAEEARQPCVIADARRARDTLDLAMVIADAAVRLFSPEATSWWSGRSTPMTTEGLRLSRTLSEEGIDLEALRDGGGRELDRLDEALRLTRALAPDGDVTLVIDHLGPFMWQQGDEGTRRLLGQLRATWQALHGLSMILADHTGGPAVAAVADETHPMFRAGDVITIRRPDAQRFIEDLAITRPATQVPVAVLRGCADLAAGVPALTWRALDLADLGLDPPAAALTGWRKLRHVCAPATARQWDSLRRVHPLAQTIIAVIAEGMRPGGTIPANSKSIGDATRTMRGLGIAWQPEPRRWAIADPLLIAYARDHAPPWVERHPR